MKSVKNAVRLDPALIYEAEMEALIHKRTTPKQIEYWAELGKNISNALDPVDLLAITQGLAQIEVREAVSYPLNPDEIFSRVEEERAAGYLAKKVTKASVSYEADASRPGMLIQINFDGSRDAGHFKNGKFVKIRTKNA